MFALVLLAAYDASASGSYGTSIATPTFRYSYVENVRKAFVDSKQAAAYMKAHDRALKVAFLGFQAKAERAIADAKKRGTPIGAYDLLLPAVRLHKPEDVATIDRKAYPLNLVLVAGTERANATFEITATRPWTASQVKALTAALVNATTAAPNHEDFEERTQREAKLVDAAGFEKPSAAVHVEDRFALYVGTVSEVQAKHRAALVATLTKKLEALRPAIQQRLNAADSASQLAIADFKPIKPVIDQHPQQLPGAFHPWGPLFSDDLVRAREDVGDVSVILMIAPQGKFRWDEVSRRLNTTLRDSGVVDAHAAAVQAEIDRLGRHR